jgi:hypothetical protein
MTELDDRRVYGSHRPGVRFEEWARTYTLSVDVSASDLESIAVRRRGRRVTLAVAGPFEGTSELDAGTLQSELSFSLPVDCCADGLRTSLHGRTLSLTARKAPAA